MQLMQLNSIKFHFLVCKFGWNSSSIQTYTLDCHLHRATYTRYRIDTIDSPDDEHRSARNM